MGLKLWKIGAAFGLFSLVLLAGYSLGVSQVSKMEDEEMVVGVNERKHAGSAGISAYLAELAGESIEEAGETDAADVADAAGYADGADIPGMETEDDGVTDACEEEAKGEPERAGDGLWEVQLMDYFGYRPTDEDMDLFYRTVQAECGYCEPDDGVGAVADVIANRCRSGAFPDTIKEVVTQENQFSTWANGMIEAAVPSEQVLEVCNGRIEEGVVYGDILFFTAGYYNPYCTPAFIIGHHYFGREKEL